MSVHLEHSTAIRSSTFLLLFFLATFLPFLKVFKIQVHLAYALIPLTILLALGLREVWSHAGRGRWIVACGLIISGTNLAMTPWVVHETTRSIYAAIRSEARQLALSVPAGTPVLCNALQIEDIRYYSRGHISVRSLAGGTPDPRDWVQDIPATNRLIQGNTPGRVFTLDVSVPETRGQLAANRANYVVRERLVDTQAFESPTEVLYRYPCLDPLQWLLPESVTAWTGPPDLEFDCYRGPDRRGWVGWKEVSANYQLYRITGNQVSSWEPNPVLIEEVSGINLVLLGNRYYGIPASEGAFTITRFNNYGYSKQFEATTLSMLRQNVQNATF